MTRLHHAFRHELSLHGRTILVTVTAVAGAVLLFQMVRWVQGPVLFNLWGGFGLVATVTGIIITSGVFGEMRTPGLRLDLLLRPAGAVEKVGAKLLLTTVFFFVAITTAYLLASLVAIGLYLALGGRGELLTFLDYGRWLRTAGAVFLDYLPVHGIFFFGAVYFRRNPVGRTLIALVGWLTGYLVLALVMIRVVFHPFLSGRYSGHQAPRALGFRLDGSGGFIAGSRIWMHVAPGFLHTGEIAGTALRIVVPLLFWGLAVLRFRESEA